ncbi:MEF2-activating motif and SAP domain-containing transcriptional regulator [Tamandua tetradactyla]|uniref:MEF2-activating motif and SAP domain-containing transcriptional regulator n=1 Tax=Tamandua tetradactyla TaxID=48850 RepID=UPI0040547316
MTLAASSQRSQIIRSKFRSVLQLRIHRRSQDLKLSSLPGSLPAGPSGSFAFSPVSDQDPWISASGLALAPAPASCPSPGPFLLSPGVLHPEPGYCSWRSPKKESPKIAQRWRESKPRGNLTYHQYMPPEPGQRSGADTQAKGAALGPPGSREGTNSQQSHPRTVARMKPTPLTPSPQGDPSPSPPTPKLELQTLKLEELTVSELRQQLRLRGLPVSGTKSMLLERMRGGAPSRERHKSRPEDRPAGAPWPRIRPKALGPARRQGSVKPGSSPASGGPPPPRVPGTLAAAPAPAAASTPSSAPASAALTLEEELQEAIRRAQLLPNRGIDDILEDPVEPADPLPPIPLDFPGSFDVLSPSPDSEGFSSVFSSSFPSPANSPSPAPRGAMDSLDWLEALSGGPPLACDPPAPSIFSADFSDSSGPRLWDVLGDPW